MTDPVAAAILAGGKSRRMGRRKALLNLGGIPLIEHVLNAVEGLADELFIVADDPAPYAEFNLPVLIDQYPSHGPLGGIQAALSAMSTDSVLILGCDYPFLHHDLLAYLISCEGLADLVVPEDPNGFPHGLIALYSKACLPAAEASLKEGRNKVADIVGQVDTRIIPLETVQRLDPGLESFIGVNTRMDLLAAESRFWGIEKRD